MTNKKLKFAAMSVALTACVAAQPLAANAAENLRPVADDPAPEQNEPSEASSSSEETVEEIKNETLNPDPEPSEDMDVKEAFGDDVDIKYDLDKATKDEETGTVTTPGDVIRKEDPDQPGETEETDKTGETDPSGSTDETGKTGETDGSEEAGEVIGSAERNETDESSSNTVTPDPGAPSTPSGPSVSGTDEDGNTTITTPTLTPGTDTTITEGTGSATADNEKKPDVTETAPGDINVKDELDGAEIPWDVKADDEKKIGDTQYVVKDVQNDGDKQTLTLEKNESMTDKMTPEDIAKLVDANYQPGEEEGTYTLTREDSYVDEDGNEHTVITFIKVNGDGLVTTTTTTVLKLKREKVGHTEIGNVESKIEYPDVTVTNEKDNKDSFTIKKDELESLIEQAKKDRNTKTEGKKTTYTTTTKDGKTYTITVDEVAAETLSDAEIYEKANLDKNKYDLGADGKIYYIGNGERVELTPEQKDAFRKTLSITVNVEEDVKGTKDKVEDGKNPDQIKNDVALGSVKDALNNAVDELLKNRTITPEEADALKARISAATAKELDTVKGGVFKADNIGKENKSFELKYSGAEVEDKGTSRDNTDTKTDITDHEVNGTAYVIGGSKTWTSTETIDSTITSILNGDHTTLPEEFKDAKIDRDGNNRITQITIGSDVYTFEYTDHVALTEELLDALRKKAAEEGWEFNEKDIQSNLTSVKWTKTTTTPGEKDFDISEKNSIVKAKDGTYTITINDTTQTGFSTTDNGKTYTKTEGNKTTTITVTDTDTALDDKDAIKKLLSKQYKVDVDKITLGENGTARWTKDGVTVEVSYSKTSKLLTMTETVLSHANAPVIDDLVSAVMEKAESLGEGDQLILSGSKKYTITRKDGKLIMKDELGHLVKDAATVKETVTEIVKTIATNYIHYDELSPEERWELLDLQQGYADGASNKYTGGCDSYWPEEGYENNAGEWKDGQWVAKKDNDGKIIGETPAQPTTNFDHLGLDADVEIETEDGTVIGGLLLNGSLGKKYELSFTYGHKEQIAGHVDMDKYPDKKYDGSKTYDNKDELHKTTGALDAKLSTTVKQTDGQLWNRSKNDYETKTKLTYTCQDKDNTNAFSGKRFYTIVGKVAYNKMDGTYSKEAADAIVEDLQNKQGKTNALSVPIQLKDGSTVYYVYSDVTDVTATGYMTASANTSAHQNLSGWKPGQKDLNDNSIPYNGNPNAGDYDLRIQGLRLVDGKVQGSYGVEYSLNMTTIKNTGTGTDNVLTVLDHTTTHTSTGTDRYGSYTVDYEQDFGWKDSEDETAKVKGEVHDSYTTFKDLIHKIFRGKNSGKEEGGSFRYSYKTEKDAELTPVSKTETSVKHAKVKYDYTTIDTAHVLIPGETTVVVTPEDPDLPAPDDETPVVTPETPELPPVQDAAPDAEPTTDVVITPATPELPPVQDAAPDVISALPKTGVNWTAAIGMALSGMALMAAGAFTSLFHKAKH